MISFVSKKLISNFDRWISNGLYGNGNGIQCIYSSDSVFCDIYLIIYTGSSATAKMVTGKGDVHVIASDPKYSYDSPKFYVYVRSFKNHISNLTLSLPKCLHVK